MKSFLIFCALLAYASASLSGEYRKFKDTINFLSEDDVCKPEFPEILKDSKEGIKCFIREFKSEANNKRINVSKFFCVEKFKISDQIYRKKWITSSTILQALKVHLNSR